MNFKIFNGRNAFYQWDSNQKLIVPGEYQIHFKAPNERSCFVLNPYKYNGETVVDVPNILLQTTEKIVVWAYVNDDEKYTTEQATFNVIPRQKPNDYVYTETEIFDYHALNERIDTIEAGGVSEETIEKAVNAYLDENPVEVGATEEQAAQIAQNTADIAELKQSGGTAGEDGATFTPSVSAQGVISWTNDKGLTNPASVNIKGPQGEQGPQGEPGSDGVGIENVERTSGTGAAGTVDTYTITCTDGSEYNFTVYNGADGSGGSGGTGDGDMKKSVYDTNNDGVVDNAEKLGGKAPDYYATADHAHGNITKDGKIGTATGQFVVTTTGGIVTAQSPEVAGSFLGLSTVATSGSYDDLTDKPNITPASIGAATADHEHDEYLTEYTETDPTVPTWAKAANKPEYTADEVGLGNVDNIKQYSASNPPPYPVTSVNGKTGDVEIASSGIVYSTDETLTDDVWIDGKPIWRKIVTATINSSQYSVPAELTNFNEMIELKGVVSNSANEWRAIPWVWAYNEGSTDAKFYIGVTYRSGTNDLYFQGGSQITNGTSVRVIMEYTKN